MPLAKTTETREPRLEVPAGALPPGRYRFQLVVEDDRGNRSEPATAEVTIREGGIPVGPIGIGPVTPGPGPFRAVRPKKARAARPRKRTGKPAGKGEQG